MKRLYLIPIFLAFFTSACTSTTKEEVKHPAHKEILPSWNDSKSKTDIINFVEKVTDPKNSEFVPVADRIATFDNDGTLWTEQPIYFQFAFAIDEAKAMIAENPRMLEDPIFNAVANDDMATVLKAGKAGLGKILMVTHAGMTTDQYNESVTNWINTAKHPKSDKLYKEMIYQPMLELIDFLKENDFSIFIVSGGGSDFMRPWAEEVYGVSKDNIIGTTLKLEYKLEEGQPKMKILPELGFNDDKEGKPMAIHQYIGRKPIAAFGNSDGDLQMLQWTESNLHLSLQVYIHHTDADREWQYDRDSKIGRLDEGLDEALLKNWTLVDMKNDWKVIYPDELTAEQYSTLTNSKKIRRK